MIQLVSAQSIFVSEALSDMFFEGRDVHSCVDDVPSAELGVGNVYFTVSFVDQNMLVPVLTPVVFAGRDLDPEFGGYLYCQDIDSYSAGVRFEKSVSGIRGKIEMWPEEEGSHVMDYERALDVLLFCSLRRRGLADHSR